MMGRERGEREKLLNTVQCTKCNAALHTYMYMNVTNSGQELHVYTCIL